MKELDFLNKRLSERREKGNLRSLPPVRDLIDFVSNDYLGLARSEQLRERIRQKVDSIKPMNGGTGSRLLSGNHELFETLENQLSKLFKSESALLFNSGYHANQALVSSVAGKGDTIIYDQLSHVCLKEGAWLSKAQTVAFRHNDIEDLRMKLQQAEGRKFVVTESIFSMDGDMAPLKEIIGLCNSFDAWLIIDEAHSTGCYGKEGSGISVEFSHEDCILARVYTFGKAMGVHGACIAGSRSLIDYLINFGHAFIYTTSLPPHSVISIQESFNYLKDHISLQDRLNERISFFRQTYDGALSTTAIQPVIVGSNEQARKLSTTLQSNGFDVRPILSPTVQKGKERLRISLHVHNSEEEIKNLVNLLKSLL